jgi:hypothetical protein
MTDADELSESGELEPAGPGAAETEHEEVDGESIAVPAGDLTGAITAAMDELTDRDDSSE